MVVPSEVGVAGAEAGTVVNDVDVSVIVSVVRGKDEAICVGVDVGRRDSGMDIACT